jgi:hypothetical protein
VRALTVTLALDLLRRQIGRQIERKPTDADVVVL